MTNFQEIANFLWSIADEVLRDDFKRGKYPDVILPFTVLRRLDCVLASTKDRVLKRYEELQGRLQEYRVALISAAVTGKIDARGTPA
jgi:type I restriction enzyme M protein